MTSTTDGPPSGMSIKDRLAQLQNSSGGKVPELSGPMKPLPKSSSTAGKPSIPLQANSVKQAPALKPVLPQGKSSDSSDPMSKTTSESVPGKFPHKMEPAFGPSMLRKTNVGQSDQTTPVTALKPPLKPTINSPLQKSSSEFPGNASSAPFSHPKKSDGESPPSEQTSPISPSSALKPPATPFKPMGSGSAPLKKTIPELPNKPGKLNLDSTPFKSKHQDADTTDQPSSSSPEGKENAAGNISKHNLSVKERLQALNQNSNTADSKTLQNGIGPLSPASSKQFFKSPTTAPEPKTEIRPVGINNSNFEDKKKIVGSFLHHAGPGKISKPGDRRSSDCLLRHTDGKKFRKIDKASLMTSLPPPSKPSKVDTFDLTMFVLEYAAAKKKFETDLMKNGDAPNGETDELYTDAESTVVAEIRQNKPLRRGPSMRVSEVPEYTEEEETQETYDDCESLKPPVEENYDDFSEGPQEIYEAVPEESNVLPSPSPVPEEKKKKKENDKDKEKEKEKEKDKDKPGKKKGKDDSHKKEEKEKKKREEEERKQRAKFGLDDKNEKLGDGIVINNSSGWMKDLNVNKGEIVSILRMHGNPTGKWLVQNMYGKIGFVQANNIEVSTPTIRQATENATLFMAGSKEEKKSSESGTKENKISESGPEEVYEPLPDEEEEGDGEMDDIYEEL